MEGVPNPRVRRILSCIRQDTQRLRHLLFYGPPGSGKTSTAKLFIESWYEGGHCPPGSVLFLNASDERGLESIRTRVFPFLHSKNLLAEHANYPRFLVFDEAETLTASAQLALRYVLEQHPMEHCCILFLVNTISGVERSLQHRFLRIRFDPLPSDCLAERVKLYAPDKESPTPLDAVRLRGDLRIFLHAPNAAQQMARHLWDQWNGPPSKKHSNASRKTLEELFWLGQIFNVLDLDFVLRLTNLSQSSILKSMPPALYEKQIQTLTSELFQKIDSRLV
jgi:ATPase family associated with various cellular activities (AAA)